MKNLLYAAFAGSALTFLVMALAGFDTKRYELNTAFKYDGGQAVWVLNNRTGETELHTVSRNAFIIYSSERDAVRGTYKK